MTIWEAPIKDLNLLNKDAAKFVFESAEKRLKHLLEVSDRTTNRAVAVVTALIPLTAFLLTTLYKHYWGGIESLLEDKMILLVWASIVVCLISLVLFGIVIFPRNMHQMGREPNQLFTEEFLEDEYYQDELQYKSYLVSETEDFQGRITFMQVQNNRRIKLFKWALLAIVFYSALLFFILTVVGIFR